MKGHDSNNLLSTLRVFVCDLGFSLQSDVEDSSAKMERVLELRQDVHQAKRQLAEQFMELRYRSMQYMNAAQTGMKLMHQAQNFFIRHPHVAKLLNMR